MAALKAWTKQMDLESFPNHMWKFLTGKRSSEKQLPGGLNSIIEFAWLGVFVEPAAKRVIDAMGGHGRAPADRSGPDSQLPLFDGVRPVRAPQQERHRQ